jgi:hypothetical protein
MKALTILLLLATLVGAGPGPMAALAQTATPATDQPSTIAPDGHEAPAASPRTSEAPRILGVRASMVIFGGAVLFFIVVLFAAEISRRTPRYRRTDIDPRR